MQFFILSIDQTNNIIDVLFKLAARQQIVLHRHKALNHLFVVQGEHRLYHPDGSLKETRAAGSYTISPASDEPHSEGGGDTDAIILFSIRASDGVLYEILDADMQILSTLSLQDFIQLHQGQLQE